MCFNGATARRPWITEDIDGSAALTATLQWGHGSEAVDNAENGLRYFVDRNGLQWGHGSEAVDKMTL